MVDSTVVILTDAARNGFIDRHDLLKALLQVQELDANRCEASPAFCDNTASLQQFLDTYASAYPQLQAQAPDIPLPEALYSILTGQGFQPLVAIDPSGPADIQALNQYGSIYVLSVANTVSSSLLQHQESNFRPEYLQVDALHASAIQPVTAESFLINIAGVDVSSNGYKVSDEDSHSSNANGSVSPDEESEDLEDIAHEIDDIVSDDTADAGAIVGVDPDGPANSETPEGEEIGILSPNLTQTGVAESYEETSETILLQPPTQNFAASEAQDGAADSNAVEKLSGFEDSDANASDLIDAEHPTPTAQEIETADGHDSQPCDGDANTDIPKSVHNSDDSHDDPVETFVDVDADVLNQIVYKPNNDFSPGQDIDYTFPGAALSEASGELAAADLAFGPDDKFNIEAILESSVDSSPDVDDLGLLLELGHAINPQCNDTDSKALAAYSLQSAASFDDDGDLSGPPITIDIDQ